MLTPSSVQIVIFSIKNTLQPCVLPAVDEMMRIMQEYGETVCVVGSCLSMANAELFCRGDTAIALFPLLPRVCGHQQQSLGIGQEETTNCSQLPLLSLAGRLISLGAALTSRASLADFDILQLISQVSALPDNSRVHLWISFLTTTPHIPFSLGLDMVGFFLVLTALAHFSPCFSSTRQSVDQKFFNLLSSSCQLGSLPPCVFR